MTTLNFLIDAAAHWFFPLDEADVRGLADDLGWSVAIHGQRVTLTERETGVVVVREGIAEAMELLDAIANRIEAGTVPRECRRLVASNHGHIR